MKWKFGPLTTAFVTLTFGVLIWGLYTFAYARPSHIDQWEVANTEFKVRITAYPEDAFPTQGVLYVFQSAPVRSGNWHKIAIVSTDQLIAEHDGWVRFVSNRVAYAFLNSYYMVTIDSGRTWAVWDANKELPVEQFMQQYNLWPGIKEIEMRPDGTGKMTLYQYLTNREKGPELYSTDYGQHWAIKE